MRHIFLAAALTAAGSGTTASAAPVQWTTASGGNGNWYEVIWNGARALTWSGANRRAGRATHLGSRGRLASVTSADEMAFLNGLNTALAIDLSRPATSHVAAWLGGSDSAIQGTWTWTTGEAFTYSNWAPGQPDNGRREDYLVGWSQGTGWNDCRQRCNVSAYVVEYAAPRRRVQEPSAVPVPAALPMGLGALGLLGWIARRRRRA